MRPILLFAIVSLSTILKPTSGATPEDYECGAAVNKTCTGHFEGQCCSRFGYCGKTRDYCSGYNCNSNWGRCGLDLENLDCGPRVNKRCTESYDGKMECCSRSGYCGTSQEYCGTWSCDPNWGRCEGQDEDTIEYQDQNSNDVEDIENLLSSDERRQIETNVVEALNFLV